MSSTSTTKLLLALLAASGLALAGASAAHARTFTGVTTTANGQGYALIADTGETYAFGQVRYRDNPRGFSGRIVGLSATADGAGYAAISSSGQVYAFGTVRYHGNPAGFSGQIVGISVTADGQGYAAISSSGQVYAFGTVRYDGNPVGFSGQIVGVSVTADGQGYAAISSSGQVYAFGTVRYHGNPVGFGGQIVGVSVTADGQGYAAISSAGQVYAYGTVRYHDNPTGFTGQIVGIDTTADGQGYVAASSIGQVYAYGATQHRGNGDPGSPPPAPASPPIAPGGAPCASTPGPGDAVTRWRPVVVCVLGMLGQPQTPETVDDVLVIITYESGGNPRAINRTDVNARRGDPSRGLMQTIGATFDAHRSPLLSGDIYDPAANIYAGLRYGIRRYGSIANIPGVKSVNRGGAYRPYALAPGASLAKCASFSVRGTRVHPTVDAMTCREARRVVRRFVGARGASARRADRTMRLRVGSRVFACRVMRFGATARTRLNGASEKTSCSAGPRRVTWVAMTGPRKRH